MNVGELLRERDRLLGVIDEAKTARHKLRQINVLIAMYGEDEKVTVKTPDKATCGYPNCNKPSYIRGVCTTHYSIWQKNTDAEMAKSVNKFILPPKTGTGIKSKKLRRVS
jgi:hypothetical protein